MPGLAPSDPHMHSTLSISRPNCQQHSNGIVSPRSMDQSHDFERLRAELQDSLLGKESISHIDAKEAEESLSLYCKPIELYNIIQNRNLKNPIFLQRCLRYKTKRAMRRSLKLTLSAERVQAIPFDVKLGKEEVNGSCISQDKFPPDEISQQVLVMLTTPLSTSRMGYSCFRLGQTHVLKTTSESISRPRNKGPLSVSFILPELKKLLLDDGEESSTFIFLSSMDLRPNCTGKDMPLRTSVNASGSVLWGSVSLTALCKNWLDSSKTGDDKGLTSGKPGVTVQVDLYPSSFQLVPSSEGQYVFFQSVSISSSQKCMGRLQVFVSGDECGCEIDEIGSPKGNGRVMNSFSVNGRRLQPGQVIFRYYYYFNQLYKSEVTENYSCPFCVQRCGSLKGLKCHLNSSHDLFKFEFMVTEDYRIVNVFCRNDVLGPEGNVRDVDGLNDPRLKHFVYWSKCRRRKSAPCVDNIARHFVLSSQNGSSALQDCPLKDLSNSVNGNSTETQTVISEVTVSKEYGPSPKLQSSTCQVSSSNLPKGISYSSTFPATMFRQVQVNIERPKKKRGRPHLNTLKITEQTLQALKKQRSEMYTANDPHALSVFGPNQAGNNLNGVCLAIAAPMLTDKSKLQHIVKKPVVHSKAFVKHQKTLAERSEARIRAQLTKREFLHSHTSQPMSLEEVLSGRDSEDEMDEEIMDLEDRRMLDDFVDVTQHEKELMHLWNSYVRKQRIHADSHCSWGCEVFAKLHAKKLNSSPALRRCFMLFLIKLWNHNLVDGNVIGRCLHTVDSFSEDRGDMEA